MLDQISRELKQKIRTFPANDQLIFNNNKIDIQQKNFNEIKETNNKETDHHLGKSIAFIDGGQAEIISAGNFCLSLIRVAALIFSKEKRKNIIDEFYLLTTAAYSGNDLFYESKLFGPELINEKDLLISSLDSTVRTGMERAPVSKVMNIARRFAELTLAAKVNADFIILDGTLEKTFPNEEKYLSQLPLNTSSLAKSSSLFTVSGNSPAILLNRISFKMGLSACWSYFVENQTFFVKLHPNAKHVFRFEGNHEALPFLVQNSRDALFLGYPYGLIAVDRLARVSETERKSLRMNFLLRTENKEISEYLSSSNAHEILDSLGA